MALLGASTYDRLQTFIYGDFSVATEFFKRAFLKHGLKAGGAVVEIGCGTGLLSPKFTADAFNYSGIDLEPDRIAEARARNPRARFICGDLNDQSVLAELDLTYTFMHGVLHHLDDQQVAGLIQLLKRSGCRVLGTMDPVRPDQSWHNPLGALACRLDDGKYVRRIADYRALFLNPVELETRIHKYPRWPAQILYMAASF